MKTARRLPRIEWIGTSYRKQNGQALRSFAAILVAALVFCNPLHAKPAAPPNFIVIMTDDQRDADPLRRMPNVTDLLTRQGVRFLNSYAVNPACCPSRATFITGQYSHNNHVWNNKDGPRTGGFSALKNDRNTLPVALQAAGYKTAMLGKYLNGYGQHGSAHYIPPGWDYWWALTKKPYYYYDYEVNDNGNVHTYGEGDANYQTDVISGLIQQFIAANASRPFFIWYTGIAPHEGYPGRNAPEPPTRYKGYFDGLALPRPPSFNEADMTDKPAFMQTIPLMDQSKIDKATNLYRRRAETLLAVDDMVQAIMKELGSYGIKDNTYIIFTSDNGWFDGEHRKASSKFLLYEEALRVPLVIRGPGIPRGEVRTQMVSNLDLPATIMDLLHATPQRRGDGKSFVPLLTNPDYPWRTAMLIEGNDKAGEGDEDGRQAGYYAGVITSIYKYAEHVDNNEVYTGNEFYDRSIDPYELQSRPGDPSYAEVVADMKHKLSVLNTCAGTTCWWQDTAAAKRH
jgi:N-acetylglucosamine-6-sulfatase